MNLTISVRWFYPFICFNCTTHPLKNWLTISSWIFSPLLAPNQFIRLYRKYLGNFGALERVDRKLAFLIRGEPSVEGLAMQEGYHFWGLPRHQKKAVEQAPSAEIQGALVDGLTGRVRP